jgi:hypothetical protein
VRDRSDLGAESADPTRNAVVVSVPSRGAGFFLGRDVVEHHGDYRRLEF